MKWKVLATLGVVLAFSAATQAATIDLINNTSGSTIYDSSGGKVIYTTTSIQPTGTGVIDPFVRIIGSTSPPQTGTQGYNSDIDNKQFDEKQDHQYTHSVLVSDLLQVTIDATGTKYYMFLLDANQTGSSPNLSLEEVRIYRASASTSIEGPGAHDGLNLTTNTFSNASADLIYTLDTSGRDNRVNLYVQGTDNSFGGNNGSGSGDMFMFVPVSLFTGTKEYLILYSQFGKDGVSGDTYGSGANKGYVQNDGFEEWAFMAGSNTTTAVPEPSSAALVLAGLAGLGLAGLRRYRRLRMAATV